MGGGMNTYYTVPEVAQMFRVCEETVRRRVRTNKWPAWRDGTQIRFGAEDIEAIRRQGAKAPTPAKEERRARNRQLRNIPVFAQ
ncbi:excisionase family DNA binding protein [Arthrobacter sp. SLBN-83]|nr:excisionase family DNA binding protein [Arthrobacter sp. SLBN-83]